MYAAALLLDPGAGKHIVPKTGNRKGSNMQLRLYGSSGMIAELIALWTPLCMVRMSIPCRTPRWKKCQPCLAFSESCSLSTLIALRTMVFVVAVRVCTELRASGGASCYRVVGLNLAAAASLATWSASSLPDNHENW